MILKFQIDIPAEPVDIVCKMKTLNSLGELLSNPSIILVRARLKWIQRTPTHESPVSSQWASVFHLQIRKQYMVVVAPGLSC